MVKYIVWLFSFFLLFSFVEVTCAKTFSYEDVTVKMPPKVTVEIVGDPVEEGSEITGIITIIHELQQKIKENSFVLGDSSIKVEKIDETKPAPSQLFSSDAAGNLVVTRYRFKLPPKEKGLYLLDIIQVSIGSNTFYANPITYTVRGTTTVRETTKQKSPSENAAPQVAPAPVNQPITRQEFKLSFAIKDKEPFYPGEKITFEYTIQFQNAIELTKEELPVFQLNNFRNIGAPKVETKSAGATTIQTITQEAVAVSPGTIHVPPSVIEGYVFFEDSYGKKVQMSQLMRAEAPGLDITVNQFPEDGKPISFSGALGLFSWKTRVLSPYAVNVGEKIDLEILVTGRGEFDTVTLPDFNLQPGFSKNFQLPDVLPVGQIVEGAKKFVLELKPLVPTITQIPEMQFSSFDPVLSRYFTTKAAPIPITIKGAEKQRVEEKKKVELSPYAPAQEKKQVSPIEIERNIPVAEKDISANTISMSTLLIIIVVLVVLFFLQIFLISWWRGREKDASKAVSRDLLMQAIKSRYNSSVSYPLIEKALLLKLYEVGEIQTSNIQPEELSDFGIKGDIKRFLLSLNKKRFSGSDDDQETKVIIEEATQLYYRLGSSPEKGVSS